jgi:hypothetical protein
MTTMTISTKVIAEAHLWDIPKRFSDLTTLWVRRPMSPGVCRTASTEVSENFGQDATEIYNTLLRISSTTRFFRLSRTLLTLCKTSKAKLVLVLTLWNRAGYHEINRSRCKTYSITRYSPVYRYPLSEGTHDGALPTIRPWRMLKVELMLQRVELMLQWVVVSCAFMLQDLIPSSDRNLPWEVINQQ